MTTKFDSDKTSPERQENTQNNQEKESNNFEKTKGKIEKVLKEIGVSLGKTTIMLFRVGVVHPEMFGELKDLRKKFEENKQKMSWESTSNILWKVRDLIDRYGNATEKSIMKDLGECLLKLQQTRSELNKMKNFDDVVKAIDNHIGKDVINFGSSLEVLNTPSNNTIKTGSPFIREES